MHVEKIGCRVIITQPTTERVDERQGLICASLMIGALGTADLLAVWQQAIDAGAFGIGIFLSLASAFAFHQSQNLRDKVWTIILNREQKTVEMDERVLAHFSEVRSVRYSAIDPRHSLWLLVHRDRGFCDIALCGTGGTAAHCGAFGQAAQLIADEIGARAERR